MNPDMCVSPASQSHDKLIGSQNPGYTGGLVGRQSLSFQKRSVRGGVMYNLFVGIDVSKDSSAAHGLDSSGKSCFVITLSMDITGFSQLYDTIRASCEDLSTVIVALESTACYHINLYSFLTSKGINTFVLNPLLIKNFAKQSLRKTKTDKKCALTIAQFVKEKKDILEQLTVSQDLQDLRDIARERESLCQQISSSKTEMKRLLQTLFPELETICSVTTKIMLNFLKEFPSARSVMMAKPRAIAKALKQRGAGRAISSFTPEDVINKARSSVATISPAKEFILKGKIATIEHLEQRRDELTRVLKEYCQAAVLEDLDIITSIKGIDKGTATTFLAEIGTISSYASCKKLIAFAGIDPSVKQSGKFIGMSTLSKRGNRHLRRVIWLMTINVIQHNKTFRAYFMKKKKEGKHFKKAAFATAHKLIRVIFALLSQRNHFKENCT